jgi:murein DD-endopeptidase MepM/ murein hydrolase activator NlpD
VQKKFRPVPWILAFLLVGHVGGGAVAWAGMGMGMASIQSFFGIASSSKLTSPSTLTVASPPANGAGGVSDEGRLLLARLDFENMGVQLLGVATFGAKSTCFVKQPNVALAQAYGVGDRIGDFQVAQIDGGGIALARAGARFRVALGNDNAEARAPLADAPGAEGLGADSEEAALALDPVAAIQGEIDEMTAEDVRQLAENDEPQQQVQPQQVQPQQIQPQPQQQEPVIVVKAASNGLKTRTKQFVTASVIREDERPRARLTASRQSLRDPSEVASVPVGKDGAPHFSYPINGHLESPFGYRRHPMGGGYRMHNGVDLSAPYGTPVRAASDGEVVEVGYDGSLGRHIFIRHGGGWETRYCHLSATAVEVGQRVSQGGAIGREGSSGESTGPHLHFEIRKDGRPVNPMFYLGR